MPLRNISTVQDGYSKAKDLTVVVNFEKDDSQEGKLRVEQARALIAELILLAKKRGRPTQSQEEFYEAA